MVCRKNCRSLYAAGDNLLVAMVFGGIVDDLKKGKGNSLYRERRRARGELNTILIIADDKSGEFVVPCLRYDQRPIILHVSLHFYNF